ncbi:glucan 13-beta-glucosidase, partial [Trifolium medium]|nr:glucan 13-beta-glucosidase [Trifolium medium]
MVDLHAAPDSQNGYEHSSSRDGSQEWGKTNESIKQTVQVIDFLTTRYAKSSSLYAVELLNEPRSPGTTLESLNKYYKDGYEAVRKHSSIVFVVLSNRLGPSMPRELFPLANGLMGSVIDVHYYSIF